MTRRQAEIEGSNALGIDATPEQVDQVRLKAAEESEPKPITAGLSNCHAAPVVTANGRFVCTECNEFASVNVVAESEDKPEDQPNVPEHEQRLRVQILDYLFDRGHRVSKPLIDAVANFTYRYGQALYAQGKMTTPTQQPDSKPKQENDV